MVKNVDYDRINIDYVANDTLDLTFDVEYNNVPYDMTGMQIDVEVKDEDDVLIASMTSSGMTPEITINTTQFTMYEEEFIGTVGKYYYDVQLTNGTKVSTICRGYFRVIKEYTD